MLDALQFTDADLFLLPPFSLLHIHTLLTNVNNNSISHNPEYPPLSLRVPAPPAPSLLSAAVGIAVSSSLSSPPLSSSSSAALNSCLVLVVEPVSVFDPSQAKCERPSLPPWTLLLAVANCCSWNGCSILFKRVLSLRESLPEASPSRTDPLASSLSVQFHSVTAVPPSPCLRSTPIRPLNY
nr:uncharacterized protein LOC112769276 [Arachis hypogaea]